MKTEGGNTTLYINKYYEINLTTGNVTSYYYPVSSTGQALGGRLVAMKQGSANVTYIHQDSLGGTSVVSDANGGLVSSITYAPFGETRSGSVATDIKFTGQRLDNTGLYYYGARYYDPQIGRFISADTLIQNQNNPQSLNRYSYVFNNPLRYTDPSGLKVEFANEELIMTILEGGLLPPSGTPLNDTMQEWAGSRLEWEEFSEKHPVLAEFLEESETVFPYKGAIPEGLLNSVPDDAIDVISNPVARAWTALNTYFGLKLAEGTGGSSFRTGPGGVLVFEGINRNSNTGNFLSLIGGDPVTFGHVMLSTIPTIPPEKLVHEYGHVYQYSVLGPSYLPLYAFDSLVNFRTDPKSWWNNKSMETFYIPGWAKLK